MYRILTLDGGGSWAVLQIMALQALFTPQTRGHDVLRAFDLVAANSGGSITLGGLIENRTLADIKDNFFLNQAQRDSIFVKLGFFQDPLAGTLRALGLGPRYSMKGKLAGLRGVFQHFGDTKLVDLPAATGLGADFPNIMICSFDYDRMRGVMFQSNSNSPAASFSAPILPTLAEAVGASTDAPVLFFDGPSPVGDKQFWDGGIAGYNNPVLVATIEALALGHRPPEIRALSLGTGSVFLPFDPNGLEPAGLSQPRRTPSEIADIKALSTAILDDPPDIASFQAHIALGGACPAPADALPVPSPVVRLSPLIQPVEGPGGAWTLPTGLTQDDFQKLVDLPMDAVAQEEIALVVKLGDAWLAGHVRNQSVRVNRDSMLCEIGCPTFLAGKQAYQDWPKPPIV